MMIVFLFLILTTVNGQFEFLMPFNLCTENEVWKAKAQPIECQSSWEDDIPVEGCPKNVTGSCVCTDHYGGKEVKRLFVTEVDHWSPCVTRDVWMRECPGGLDGSERYGASVLPPKCQEWCPGFGLHVTNCEIYKQLSPGCRCSKDFVRGPPDGVCIPREKCPDMCPSQHQEARNQTNNMNCERLCSGRKTCPFPPSVCVCQKDYIRASLDGPCVSLDACAQHKRLRTCHDRCGEISPIRKRFQVSQLRSMLGAMPNYMYRPPVPMMYGSPNLQQLMYRQQLPLLYGPGQPLVRPQMPIAYGSRRVGVNEQQQRIVRPQSIVFSMNQQSQQPMNTAQQTMNTAQQPMNTPQQPINTPLGLMQRPPQDVVQSLQNLGLRRQRVREVETDDRTFLLNPQSQSSFPNQACSCDLECSLFDDCCPDFREECKDVCPCDTSTQCICYISGMMNMGTSNEPIVRRNCGCPPEVEADKKKLEADKKKLEADKEKLESDKEKLESDKEKLESDKKKLESDKEKLESDKKTLESDKKTLESDKKTLESDKKTRRDSSEETRRDSSEETRRDSSEETRRDSSEETRRDSSEETRRDSSEETREP